MPKQNFNLESKFYGEPIIEEAITAFEGYDIVYRDGVLWVDDENTQMVFDEFSNYCIGLSNASSF